MAMLMLNDDLRAHLGGSRRGQAGRRLLADGDPGGQGDASRSSGSSPRPTGTWSGSCSSRASTTATTRSSTTGWNTGNAESVRQHLLADHAYQDKLVRFIENHDEPRAAATFPAEKGRAAAVAILTLPGARLLHEGQFEGRKVRLPVFLGRRPAEPPITDLAAFYRTPADGDRSGGLPERRLASLRAERLARQPELPEPPGLVLGQGGPAVPHRHQFRDTSRPGARPGAVG